MTRSSHGPCLKTMRTLFIAALIFALAPAALAETLYRWVGPDGTVHYSDKPPPDAAQQAQELKRTPGAIYSQKDTKGTPNYTDQRVTPYAPPSAEAPATPAKHQPSSSSLQPVTASAMLAPMLKALVANARYFLWLLVIFLLGTAFKDLTPKLKGMLGESRIRKRLERAGIQAMHDVILPGNQGGLTQIDHLALMPWGIAVIETKYREGRIFGKAGETHWTQRVKRRTYKFQNPLRQNHMHLQAVRALAPAVAVEGLVVFTGDFEFPNGMPQGVAGESNLMPALERVGRELPDERTLQASWTAIATAARTDRASRRQHLKALRERLGYDLREAFAYGMLVLAAGLAAWLWLS